jgi:hypothetical protein
MREALLALHGKQIDLPERFTPKKEFLVQHRADVFERNGTAK